MIYEYKRTGVHFLFEGDIGESYILPGWKLIETFEGHVYSNEGMGNTWYSKYCKPYALKASEV